MKTIINNIEFKIIHVDHLTAGYGHKRILTLISYKGIDKQFIATTDNMQDFDNAMDLELFRTWYLAGLHERLKKLPKNPKTEKSIKRKTYLLTVAEFFDIETDKPFSGNFYFESVLSSVC